jgi:hypothetical protein
LANNVGKSRAQSRARLAFQQARECDQPRSVILCKALAGHATAFGNSCATLVARSDAEALRQLA